MAVSILAALGLGGIAAAASFPSGFGFGAGYGSGVRAGYDIIYPRIAPYFDDIIEFLVPQYERGNAGKDALEDSVDIDPGEKFAGETGKIPGIIEDVITKPDIPIGPGGRDPRSSPRLEEVLVRDVESARRLSVALMKMVNSAYGRLKNASQTRSRNPARYNQAKQVMREAQNKLTAHLKEWPELRSN